ncbi:diaminopimelate decarboxylase [Streptacidiphilus sp. N1-10]|uniref:Diaminopimelate decarboxylase n=1 Tax=Streptacidiphilus jeojiensis TaxID=3229225 RepID=A0ABV6XVV6_9ACTN
MDERAQREAPETSLDRAVRAAAAAGLVGPEHPVAGFLDADAVLEAVGDLHEAFDGVAALHTFAVKAAPLVPVLRLLGSAGMGWEAASPGELALALAAGAAADRVVLDSPAKTRAELAYALKLGAGVNADNLDELERIKELLADHETSSALGIRLNPQVGTGVIEAMSTAGASSKFGTPIGDPGDRERAVGAVLDLPQLSRVHVHVGSQGCSLELMATGVRAAYEFAEEVNNRAGHQQVRAIDIGGGLPVNFQDDQRRPAFREYADLLRTRVPGLFSGRYELVTEFGRSLVAKAGFIAAQVEYTKEAGGRRIALTHAGAQVATRTVLMPQAWPLRVSAYDAAGAPHQGEPVVQDVAGPCCFAGDLVARERVLPRLSAGDLVVLHDTGGYYYSSHWAYNSLARPAIYAFTTRADANGAQDRHRGAGTQGGEGQVRFAVVRAEQSIEEILAESGACQRDALTRLLDGDRVKDQGTPNVL